VRAVGVDEKTSLLLDRNGSLVAAGNGTAFLCELSVASLAAMTCAEGAPLSVAGVACERLQAAGFDDLDQVISSSPHH
jgi:hypothetical protein